MKILSALSILLMLNSMAQDVWYDAGGRAVIETVREKPGRLQPRDLIVTDLPLLRVSEVPWRRDNKSRARCDLLSWWWPGSFCQVNVRRISRVPYLRPGAGSIQQKWGMWIGNFSYQCRGGAWSCHRCR